MKRLLPFAPLVVAALLGLLFAGYGLHHDPKVLPAAMVGKPVPARSLTPLAGGAPIPIARAAGAPMLVNLFASWCLPCAEEQPALLRLKAHGTPIVGIAYEDAPANTQTFLDRLGDPFRAILVDRSGDVGVDFGISGVPETFLVDRNGMIVAKHTGPMSEQDADALEQKLRALR